MAWRVANGFRAMPARMSPGETENPAPPPMPVWFKQRMVTSSMKYAYTKKDQSTGYKKIDMGIGVYWHSYGVPERAAACMSGNGTRVCGIGWSVTQESNGYPTKCSRCGRRR